MFLTRCSCGHVLTVLQRTNKTDIEETISHRSQGQLVSRFPIPEDGAFRVRVLVLLQVRAEALSEETTR